MKFKAKLKKEYDIIVVGTGPAGGTLAEQMSRMGASVLMIEKGAYHPKWIMGNQVSPAFIADKMGFLSTREGLTVARGITVGGSAVLSCGSALPPYPGMFEKAGVDINEEVKMAHDYMGVDEDFPDHLIGKNQMHIMEIANSMGYEFRKMPKFINREKCKGEGCMKGCPTGAKWSGRVPVEKALENGAHLVTCAEVTRAIEVKGEVVGVETKNGDKIYGNTVVLAAGGLGTPMILKKSGISEAGDKFGFDPLLFTYGYNKDITTVKDLDMGIVCDNYMISDGFVLSTVMDTLGSFILSATAGGGWSYLHKTHKLGKAVSIMTKIKDDLGGKIYDDGTFSKPLTDNDWNKLKKGEVHAIKILKAAGCRDIFSTKPFASHPCASVRIGENVDTNMESRIKNLFVCDTAAFPEPMGVPCVLTCTALGFKMADILKERLGLQKAI
ncbi:MAG: GMC family oxidoreductase [Deltaproteobacteria bacterium]|nr:GMC family oxidoreductase [Deltaproteobacteria bacterium]